MATLAERPVSETGKRRRGRPARDKDGENRGQISVPSKEFQKKVADLADAAGVRVEDWVKAIPFYTYVLVKHAELMDRRAKESQAELRKMRGQLPPME